MDDVIYHVSGLYRLAFGDVSVRDPRAANFFQKSFLLNDLKGVRIVDADTLEVYIDRWHPDPGEIAFVGNLYPPGAAPVPWEIGEVALQTVVDGVTALNVATANTQKKIHMDLGRNPASIAALDAAWSQFATTTHIPQGMETWITPEEAAARYVAAGNFRETYGHWYASNGPFVLESLNPDLRQTVVVAFRDGYPFPPDHWDFLIDVEIPELSFGAFPTSMVAGQGATLPFTSTLAGKPADPDFTRWFVRELATGFVVLEDEPIRTSVGEFEVQLLSTETIGLASGSFELMVIVQGVTGSEVRTFAFTVTSQLDFFSALFDELDDRLAELSDQTAQLGRSVDAVQGTSDSLSTLLTAVLALAITAIVVPSVMILVVLRRLPPRPS